MTRKLFCLALLLAMLGCLSMAMAASSSISASDLSPPEEPSLQNKRAEELSKVYEFIGSGRPVIDYFGRSAVSKLLSVGDLNSMVLVELVAVALAGGCCEDFSFPTVFADDAKLIAFLGVTNADGAIVWIPLKACAVSGKVRICCMCKIAAAEKKALLAILWAK